MAAARDIHWKYFPLKSLCTKRMGSSGDLSKVCHQSLQECVSLACPTCICLLRQFLHGRHLNMGVNMQPMCANHHLRCVCVCVFKCVIHAARDCRPTFYKPRNIPSCFLLISFHHPELGFSVHEKMFSICFGFSECWCDSCPAQCPLQRNCPGVCGQICPSSILPLMMPQIRLLGYLFPPRCQLTFM